MKQKHCIRLLLAVLVVLSHFRCFSQVKGYVLDQNGDPLPFATILIEGSSAGTSANLEGYYELKLPERGDFNLIFSYVGYITGRDSVVYEGTPITLNKNLTPASLAIKEFVYDGSAEDPAYGIIREVQKKRLFHLNEAPAFTCNAYVKGLIKIDSTPAQILGISFDEILDDQRNKILYLSETESTLLSNGGGAFKEIIHASVVSGTDQGLSFNSAKEMDFNLYKNFYELNRPLISPIGKNALIYYRYKLKRSYFEEDGRKIYEIKVWPKRADDPCYTGLIFIYEGSWDIHSSELGVNGSQSFEDGLDTLIVQQQYYDIKGTVHKFPVNRRIFLSGGLMGIQFSGNFNAVYSDYELSEKAYQELGKREEFIYETEAVEKSKTYFDSIRPIPLNKFEQVDYTYKDSLLQLRNDPIVQDSLDKVGNRVKVNNLVLGYSWRSSKRNLYVDVPSPLESLIFHPVQGRIINLSPRLRKYDSKKRSKRLVVEGQLNYGLAEQKLRYGLNVERKFNNFTNDRIGFGFGVQINDMNDTEVLNPFVASLTALYFHRNPLKVYERTYINLRYRRTLGVLFNASIQGSWEQRKSLKLASDFSYFYPERAYSPNNPFGELPQYSNFENSVVKFEFDFAFYPGRTYQTYPHRRRYINSKWPIFYSKATVLAYPDQLNYKWSLGIRANKISFGNWGQSRLLMEGRGFINPVDVHYLDFHHFAGNEISFNSAKHLQGGFFLMPYYRLSTTATHALGIWEHDFGGLVMSKIPLIKKMNLALILRGGAMYSNEGYYAEYSVGLDRLGIKFWRGARIDYVLKTYSSFVDIPTSGLRFSISL